jgi:tRNA pseudouridine55 synthase
VSEKPLVPQGILLVDKPSGRSSFSVVACVRKRTLQPTVGHAGTLDPFATGLLVILLGKIWTKQSNTFLNHDKEYEAVLRLGQATDSYDRDGAVVAISSIIPTQDEIEECLSRFQGNYLQTPPMFSAKKVDGKRLYELARKGISIEREQSTVHIATTLLTYSYPELKVHIRCSKGTYVRAIAHDIGNQLGCLAYVQELVRTRSGPFCLCDAVPNTVVESLTPESTHPLLFRSELGSAHT